MFFFSIFFALPALWFMWFLYSTVRERPAHADEWMKEIRGGCDMTKKEEEIMSYLSEKTRGERFFYVHFFKLRAFYLFLQYLRAELPNHTNERYIGLEGYLDIFNYTIYVLKVALKVKLPYHTKIAEIESKVPDEIKKVIDSLIPQFSGLNEEENRKLNEHDSERWKNFYQAIEAEYTTIETSETKHEDIETGYTAVEKFIADIDTLIKNNGTEVAQREIHLKAHKFLVTRDKVASLQYYIRYFCYETLSSDHNFKYKPVTARDKKILFDTPEQLKKFEKILSQLQQKKKRKSYLNSSLLKVENIFIKEKRRIVLDTDAIQSARNDLAGVVDILNEYLEEPEAIADNSQNIQDVQETENTSPVFNTLQTEFLKLFEANNFHLEYDEVDNFVHSKGMFKSQLIEGINEQFYEELDDLLIEEDGDHYTLNKEYYQHLIS
ncbi:tellurite resistance TerB C-terminal domain-containing protein [Dysgonomonas macrotermitis]|nr:tellurite resistance TerB C-terminal domain-containing protein [Dysgonomonas macrotermitis]